MRINLLVACHEEDAARALCRQLMSADARIAAEPTTLSQATDLVLNFAADVLMVECGPNLQPALAVLRIVRLTRSDARVLMLNEGLPQEAIPALIQHGARGCVKPSAPASFQAKAVCAVHDGEVWFGRCELLAALRSHLADAPTTMEMDRADELQLTPRERQILSLLGSALTNKEIARDLDISELTVKTHLHHIYLKLHRSGRYSALLPHVMGAPHWAI